MEFWNKYRTKYDILSKPIGSLETELVIYILNIESILELLDFTVNVKSRDSLLNPDKKAPDVTFVKTLLDSTSSLN